MDDDFFRELMGRSKRAHASRPEVPSEDLLFTVAGPEEALTVREVNAAGEPLVFLVVRVATAPSAAVVAGSMRVACDRCGAAAWMSPATRQTYDRIERRQIVCIECAGLPTGTRIEGKKS